MDLGSGTFTSFTNDESVVAYIAENIDLFACDMGLVHSHHTMGAFFSGTDTGTLREEGNDTNCFVSLIVDTKGTYQAAITRKIQIKKEVITKDLGSSYEFFGEGSVNCSIGDSSISTQTIDKEVIQYFMLNVEIEPVDNPLAYLDTRFEEIEAYKKRKSATTPVVRQQPVVSPKWNQDGSLNNEVSGGTPISEDTEFREWLHRKDNKQSEKPAEPQQQALFDEETMKELEAPSWTPNPELIHQAVARMLMCSLALSTKKIDLKQWVVRHMENVYSTIFPDVGGQFDPFNAWVDFSTEFFVEYFDDDSTPWDSMDVDTFNQTVAGAMIEELYMYADINPFIQSYIDSLSRYTDI